MSMDHIIETVRSFDGALVLQPGPGDGTPEIAWGDVFFYCSPDGQVPAIQPYGTIVTKNYPDDSTCDLDEPGRWRVNVHVGRDRLHGLAPGAGPGRDRVPTDRFLAHPLYGDLGWVCVVDPAERTTTTVLSLLRDAHAAARERYERRRALRG